MSFWKQLLIALCIGTSLGIVVPLATNYLNTELVQTQAPVDIITEFKQHL
ncbi:MAG: hypothetical protein PHZ11_08205 [Desulfitobacteriaceae bacterium]|nr:hypothetical protein [Desulfitobacteriaceae bacterium]MDD4346850.1 hypothetical protein [Desulfitobacteriaceae bacterium]